MAGMKSLGQCYRYGAELSGPGVRLEIPLHNKVFRQNVWHEDEKCANI